jgi:hypothetical protein
VERHDLAFEIEGAKLVRGDVGGELDDLDRLARGIEHGIVGGLDPDLTATLGDPLVLGGLELAAPQTLPECAVSRALALRRFDEQAVMVAADLIQGVAHRGEEIRVGVQDGSVEREFDCGERPAQGGQLGILIPAALEALEHDGLPVRNPLVRRKRALTVAA